MTAKEILANAWNKKYSTQPYKTSHLHRNYEDLVLQAMSEYAESYHKSEMIRQGFLVDEKMVYKLNEK